MKPSFWGTIFFMLALIALYLIVVNSGGSVNVLGGITNLATSQTKALQGR